MPTPSADAFLTAVSKEQIESLAILYDRFAHALDPFSAERDEAERVFMQEVANLYDSYGVKTVSYHEFRKAVILRCKRHLHSTDKPSSI